MTVASSANAQDKWLISDKATIRLKPKAFSQLPKNIVSYLQARGCVVPQISGETKPHNVIRGQFAKSGQFDWAVLCSRNRVSAILVFWKGSTQSVAEIARAADRDFLQTDDGGKASFSRAIEVADKNYITDHNRKYNGAKLPPILNQGINDVFIEKGSSVHYFYRKRWLNLQGAD